MDALENGDACVPLHTRVVTCDDVWRLWCMSLPSALLYSLILPFNLPQTLIHTQKKKVNWEQLTCPKAKACGYVMSSAGFQDTSTLENTESPQNEE